MSEERTVACRRLRLYFFGEDPKRDLAGHLGDEPFMCDFILFYLSTRFYALRLNDFNNFYANKRSYNLCDRSIPALTLLFCLYGKKHIRRRFWN